MKTESTTNKRGYVVIRHHRDAEGRITKNEKVSAPLLSESAARDYADLCKKQGWEVSVVES